MTSLSSAHISSYRVLARKYRPSTLQEMVGQEGLVTVLTNGIQKGRLPHAFMLTGIRGVGKTTTARFIARALNCIGPEGKGEPTPFPCGQCEPCLTIAEGRHIDVIEMDAASHTSVEDVRDIIAGARYKAVSARFKIYIVDEVHMLSKSAFNAFLKTLEEPPPHVKFIFATTELEKVPDTVLSRCLRLQLKRIPSEILKEHFSDIAGREGFSIEAGALALIARAAQGSARDGLSLLDQAMMLCEEKSVITESTVLEMLGLSDRTAVFHIFKWCIEGKPEKTLAYFQKTYLAGADPLMILRDLLDLIHWAMLEKNNISSSENFGLSAEQKTEALSLISSLSFPCLSRCWQTLIKGLEEAASAPSARQGAEVILLRLCYLSGLPTPHDLLQTLKKGSDEKASPLFFSDSASEGPANLSPLKEEEKREASGIAASEKGPETFEELLALCGQKREMLLRGYLENQTHLISYCPGEIVLRFLPNVPQNTAKRLRELLTQWTGKSWDITLSNDQGAPTKREQLQKEREEIRVQTLQDPLMQTALEVFPSAEIEYIEDHP